MSYRSDLPRCPTCGGPATSYDTMWDYLYCAEHHAWDGPLNNQVLQDRSPPSSGWMRGCSCYCGTPSGTTSP